MDALTCYRLLVVCSVGWLVALSGCQTVPSKWTFPWEKEEGPQLPDRVLAIWTDTVLHQPGEASVRGFGGRLFFYAEGQSEPIAVDGAVKVYVFDADDADPSNPRPEKTCVWTADQFGKHVSDSSLGPSYSVWVPWDEVGGEPRSLSLVVTFEGRQGGIVISDPVVKLLPGIRKASTTSDASPDDGRVRQASYAAEIQGSRGGADSVENRTRDVETIDLPPSFYRHLRSSDASLAEPGKDLDASPASRTRVGESEGRDATNRLERESTEGAVGAESPPTDRWRKRFQVRSLQRQYPARTMPESRAERPFPRREPLPGGWLDGLQRTPQSGARLLPPPGRSDAAALQATSERERLEER